MTLPSVERKKSFFQSALFPVNMKSEMLREFEDWLLSSNVPRISEVEHVHLDDHHPWLIRKPLIKYIKDSANEKAAVYSRKHELRPQLISPCKAYVDSFNSSTEVLESVYPHSGNKIPSNDSKLFHFHDIEAKLCPDPSLLCLSGIGFRGFHVDEDPAPGYPTVAVLTKGKKIWLFSAQNKRTERFYVRRGWTVEEVIGLVKMNPSKFNYCIQEVNDTVFIPKLICHTVISVDPEGSNLLSTWVNLEKVTTKAATLEVLLPTGSREGGSGKKHKLRGLFNRRRKFVSKKKSKSVDN